jgi:TetR/AcrR family transcriptional repressor of mexJK operon
MKDWPADHPKAKLMARKRAQILDASREAFLTLGYEKASMEAIAAKADVSIMTLYRHAESKEDLFSAVIARACDPTDPAEQELWGRILKQPLEEVLTQFGLTFQGRLADPDTVALMRVVMAESVRFPALAELAYSGFVGHLEQMAEWLMASVPESSGLPAATRKRLSKALSDRLFGADMLRVLLGLKGASAAEQKRRAQQAAAETVAEIAAERSEREAG